MKLEVVEEEEVKEEVKLDREDKGVDGVEVEVVEVEL